MIYLVCDNCKEEIRDKLFKLREEQLKRAGGNMAAFEAGIIVGFLNNVNKSLLDEFMREV